MYLLLPVVYLANELCILICHLIKPLRLFGTWVILFINLFFTIFFHHIILRSTFIVLIIHPSPLISCKNCFLTSFLQRKIYCDIISFQLCFINSFCSFFHLCQHPLKHHVIFSVFLLFFVFTTFIMNSLDFVYFLFNASYFET